MGLENDDLNNMTIAEKKEIVVSIIVGYYESLEEESLKWKF